MKRITSIVLVLAVLIVSVSSFASSDGGLILKNWYERVGGQADDEVVETFVSEMISENRKVYQESTGQKAGAEVELGIFSALISEDSAKEVLNYQKHYILKTRETEQALRNKDFSDFKGQETANLSSELNEDAVEILADILQ